MAAMQEPQLASTAVFTERTGSLTRLPFCAAWRLLVASLIHRTPAYFYEITQSERCRPLQKLWTVLHMAIAGTLVAHISWPPALT